MKFLLNKKLRMALIGLVSVALAAAVFFLVKDLVEPEQVEEKVPEYTYSQKAQVNYRVWLTPNSLYTQTNIDEGNIYITNFVDYINTYFTYTFSGERVAEVKGEYNVVALLEATTGSEDNVKKIWQRQFQLAPDTGFTGSGQEVSTNRELPLVLPDYNAFVKNVNKESEITPDNITMTVYWNVKIEAVTDSGPVNDQLTATMDIPLSKKYFQIGGELKKETPGAINSAIQVPVVDKEKIVTCGIVSGVLLICLVLLLLFTAADSGKLDPMQRKLKQILKKHGDRLAVIEGDIPPAFDHIIPVKSMDDLVRIADELSKPIVYKPASNEDVLPSFYVFDEPKIFMFKPNENTRSGKYAL